MRRFSISQIFAIVLASISIIFIFWAVTRTIFGSKSTTQNGGNSIQIEEEKTTKNNKDSNTNSSTKKESSSAKETTDSSQNTIDKSKNSTQQNTRILEENSPETLPQTGFSGEIEEE